MKRRAKIVLLAAATAVAVTGMEVGPAGAIYIYPAKGQSEEQQQRDKFDCSQWATQQTGFDPTNPQRVQTAQTQQRGGAVRGAAGGAALGAVGGAIGGDAGKGAAIGAGVGAGAGMMRRNRSIREQQQEQAQINQNYNSQVNGYNEAYGTCLKGKGYSVG
jgi:hypothetical protein